MKILVLSFVFAALGCTGPIVEETSVKQDVSEVRRDASQTVPEDAQVGRLKIWIAESEGKCVLSWTKLGVEYAKQSRSVDVRMAAPCGFVRDPVSLKPLHFTYQKGTDQRTVFLVTGGKTDPSATDNLRPDGCGTWIAKILVFRNRVEIAWSRDNGAAWCPTAGADEVMFAA